MKVKDIMHSFSKISPNLTISESAKIMDEKLIGSVLVEEKGNIVGIMTERDILRKVVAKGLNPDKIEVKDIMTSPLITIDANEGISKASEIMDEKRIRRLLVVENGKIIGKLTANSLARRFKYLLARDTSKYSRVEFRY
jgi:CBS domain-containing protein